MLDSPDPYEAYNAIILAEDVAADRDVLDRLRATPEIDVIDQVLDEGRRWAYYPWRRAIVSIGGPDRFNAARLDRNRNIITSSEQQRLQGQRIGIVGLSSGHAIAYIIAAQGLCGLLRLADFDALELPNLNRVPATVFDLGTNKATVAARRIAEFDPYLKVEVCTSGVTSELVDQFLDGLDVVVDQADSLDVKVFLREAARGRRIPVIMATSDRGRLDVERYDLEPQRPIMHGLLGDIDMTSLRGLSTKDKLPYLLRLLDARRLSSRGAASLIEVGKTLEGWPQVAGDIWVGAAAVAEAARRIGLGEPLSSGRTQIDLGDVLDRISPPAAPDEHPGSAVGGTGAAAGPEAGNNRIAETVAEAAIRAPSGGNSQPWRIVIDDTSMHMLLMAQDSSTMDVGFRGSAVALGAGMFNARVAAAAHAVLGPVSFDEDDPRTPLRATMTWGHGNDLGLAKLYHPMLARQSNRHVGVASVIEPDVADMLATAAANEGASIRLIIEPSEVAAISDVLAGADRVRYLTPRLHEDLISELRWPADALPETGIDVRSLELDAGELAALELVRRADVMAELARWDAGAALGDITRARVTVSAALVVVVIDGSELADYARGGAAMEAVWVTAQQCGFGVQPVSPVFLYAQNHNEMQGLSSRHAELLCELQHRFRGILGLPSSQCEVMILRLVTGPPPSVPSRRRSLSATMGAARK
ncbi:MAG: Rv1355c family protein [Mycobacterium sp.]|uniref:Rv1355c family protein n=1 Tax=Mycobacterium sp. TaxID=1785 RepID=UPI001EC2C3EE|nr:Rv1355c family protein [Mycobacterium sp.]MBW0017199.1 Rv1355c family protein [Mycobacterium sp.]